MIQSERVLIVFSPIQPFQLGLESHKHAPPMEFGLKGLLERGTLGYVAGLVELLDR